MSEIEQRSRRSAARTELYVATANPAPWAIELLLALVRYPLDHSTLFAEFDTIAVGQPVDQKGSLYTSLLLIPPGAGDDPDSLGAFGLQSGATVFVHQIIGIFESECDFAIEHGGKELWSRLRAVESATLLDVPRRPVA